MLMLLTVITNYPQAMLKSECLNEDNMSVEIVDKIYKSKISGIADPGKFCGNRTEHD